MKILVYLKYCGIERTILFRNLKPNTQLALVIYNDGFSTSADYDGSICTLVPLPNSRKNVAFSQN
ncbi:MAG: hypothetical protein AABX07_02350 [Nanoarchaeota archaeon]